MIRGAVDGWQLGAPERQPGQVRPLPAAGDARPAATARPSGPAVDVQRAGRSPIAGRRHAFGSAAAGDVGEQEALARRHQARQRLVIERRHLGEGRHPLDEEDLALVDVADPGERPLVGQRLGDRAMRAARVAQTTDGLVGIEAGRRGGRDPVRPAARAAPRRAVRAVPRPGHRSRPRRRPAPRGRAGRGPAGVASAHPAGSDATSRSCAGGSGSRGRPRSGSAGSCRPTPRR